MRPCTPVGVLFDWPRREYRQTSPVAQLPYTVCPYSFSVPRPVRTRLHRPITRPYPAVHTPSPPVPPEAQTPES